MTLPPDPRPQKFKRAHPLRVPQQASTGPATRALKRTTWRPTLTSTMA